MTRRRRRFALGCLAIAAAGLVVLTSIAWYYLPLGPFLDDGPFHGAAVAPIDGGEPSQQLVIFNGFTLEVFDPAEQGVSPIVQLRDQSGAVRWAIRADGHKTGDVYSVRFKRSRRGFTRSGTVEGSVEWTYGHEYSVWFVTHDGDLRDYWYSW